MGLVRYLKQVLFYQFLVDNCYEKHPPLVCYAHKKINHVVIDYILEMV